MEDLHRDFKGLYREIGGRSRLLWFRLVALAHESQQLIDIFCFNFTGFICSLACAEYSDYTMKVNSSSEWKYCALFDKNLISLFQVLAVAVSYFARKISTGELNFPPPPEPVALCPVHIKSAICSCLPTVNHVLNLFKKEESLR